MVHPLELLRGTKPHPKLETLQVKSTMQPYNNLKKPTYLLTYLLPATCINQEIDQTSTASWGGKKRTCLQVKSKREDPFLDKRRKKHCKQKLIHINKQNMSLILTLSAYLHTCIQTFHAMPLHNISLHN